MGKYGCEIESEMYLRKDFMVQKGKHAGRGFIASARGLKEWLFNSAVWGPPDETIPGRNTLAKVAEIIDGRNGIYIILNDGNKQVKDHATLWLGDAGDVIGKRNQIGKGGTIYFWKLKDSTATETQETSVQGGLGSEIQRVRGIDEAEITFDGSATFIEKLIDDMDNKRMETGWLENVKDTPIVLINQQMEVIRENGEKINIDPLALVKPYENVTSVIINVRNAFFGNADGRNEKVLQSIVLHELRHVWQENNWGKIYSQNSPQKKDDKINIYAEVDAYNTQFKFETQMVIKVNQDTTNIIRNGFKGIENDNTKATPQIIDRIKANELFIEIRVCDKRGIYLKQRVSHVLGQQKYFHPNMRGN